ncbi:hypothetical protein, partial [Nocardia sp. NPDC059239]|uniref:hypothetical protein n=1 Tax=Nocardia sp. NPDC059239 TaxID=3346785 RepID=UPI0036BCD53E
MRPGLEDSRHTGDFNLARNPIIDEIYSRAFDHAAQYEINPPRPLSHVITDTWKRMITATCRCESHSKSDPILTQFVLVGGV